jgi:hypothetical protein
MMGTTLAFPGTARTELGGLRGETLTGFLAALGTLRLLAETGEHLRLAWRSEAPHAAMLECAPPDHPDALEDRVAAVLERRLDALDLFPGKMKIKDVQPGEYRQAFAAAMAAPDRFASDLLAALTSDAAVRPAKDAKPEAGGRARKGRGQDATGNDEAASKPTGGGLLDPAWCVLDGAQQRNLFAAIRRFQEIARLPKRKAARSGNLPVLVDRVRSALFGPWREVDEKASLYLDQSLREHAYRWTNPLNDPARFDGIANLLALVGISLLPAVPVDRNGTVALVSACCVAQEGGRVALSWPIWRGAVSLGGVRRLVLLPGLTADDPPADLASRGVEVVYRAEAYPLEKGARTYAHPQPVWRARTP